MLPAVSILLAAALAPQAPDPNDPGILDPMLEWAFGSGTRAPATHQVATPSELINIVGRVKRKDADTAPSPKGFAVSRVRSPEQDLEDALGELSQAALVGNAVAMQARARDLLAILDGTTQGEVYDGFPFQAVTGPAFPDHVPGEYRAKRALDTGLDFVGLTGNLQKTWAVEARVLFADDRVDCDTRFVLFPPEADPFDRLYVRYRIWSTETADLAPTDLLTDFPLAGTDRLGSKSLDATWVRVPGDTYEEVVVDHGTLGNLTGIRIWRWRPERPVAHLVQPVFESVDPRTGLVVRDARGRAAMDLLRGLGPDDSGPAAPEAKMRAVAEAVLAGATPATVRAMLEDVQTAPLGTWREWLFVATHPDVLPREAWAVLAAEGITPGPPAPGWLGPYHAVLAFAGQRLYAVADDRLPVDPLTGRPIPGAKELQGVVLPVKVLNLDPGEHYLEARDFGAPLHDDIAKCDLAPSGSHSLEILNDKPVHGAPKYAELQWRAGWALRRGIGILEPYDLFPRGADRALVLPFEDPNGGLHFGWAWPSSTWSGAFRVDPPDSWLGGVPGGLREPGGPRGLDIGRRTPGFGTAKMPTGDLAPFHPLGLVNTDTDGDGVDDALVFPDWLRNPDPLGGDVIPTTPEWEPFLYLSPHNGTPWLDPLQPELGPWARETFAFGRPVPPGANEVIEVHRVRAAGQMLWFQDGAGPNRAATATDHHDHEY